MPREVLLELLLSAVARPHTRCLRSVRQTSHQCLRYASTQQSRDRSTKPSNADPLLKARSPSNIPLHVGLDRNPEHLSAISRIPIPKGERGEQFTPAVLARPLGLQTPPQAGQNSPVDNRTFSEKRADFSDYERALERRQIYLRTFLRPYFQEWRRVDHHKGKSFQSSNRLFRRDKALYFPNMWGQTLAKEGDPDGGRDTTPVLRGKISVVGIQSGQWAEEQVDTFIGQKENPELQNIINNSAGRIQRVDINIQGDLGRSLLVKLFSGRLRRMVPEERWSRYFKVRLPRDVRRGLTDDVRDAMGLLNTQVGYVYLLDADCKIRWAGSGHAWPGEIEGLNSGIKRLLEEASDLNDTKTSPSSSSLRKQVQNEIAEAARNQNLPPAEPLAAAS